MGGLRDFEGFQHYISTFDLLPRLLSNVSSCCLVIISHKIFSFFKYIYLFFNIWILA